MSSSAKATGGKTSVATSERSDVGKALRVRIVRLIVYRAIYVCSMHAHIAEWRWGTSLKLVLKAADVSL